MLRGRKRWPWQPVQAATAAVTEAISSRGPALLVRLDRLWLLVVGQMLLNEKSQLKPYAMRYTLNMARRSCWRYQSTIPQKATVALHECDSSFPKITWRHTSRLRTS